MSSKKQRSNTSRSFNDLGLMDGGAFAAKCSICGLESSPGYSCVKCHRIFHEHCDSFRTAENSTGICGSCLTAVSIPQLV